MQQLVQQLKNGAMQILDVPMPLGGAGLVTVRNHYSLISAGTEGSTVKAARMNLLEKAMAKPQQVKQVLDTLVAQGPAQTWRAVMKKLDAYSPLGYSTAGEVIEVGAGVRGFAVGDRVACAGAGYASHAEVVAVPENLCVKLAPDADLRRAAYNTLGAIALQGVRQADLRLGECAAVIGLGLIGQLTVMLLRAAGVRVIGIDVGAAAVAAARQHGIDLALERQTPGLAARVQAFTGGIGADAVLITAGTDSTDPVNLAGEIARHKGRVVIVGAVPTGFERDPHWYRKELDLRMSCSYGPGRYDPTYEEQGRDYPAGYVRWTEQRNMAAFQALAHAGAVAVDTLTTHEFELADAVKAYDLIVNRTEPFLGILLRYDAGKPMTRAPLILAPARPAGPLDIAFIGAGSYAQGNLLPHLPTASDLVRRAVLTATGTTARRVAEQFKFECCAAGEQDILAHPSINTVFIATRHDSHADLTVKGLRAGKHVFVEKPLALNETELTAVEQALRDHPDRILMVGFNRRFAPLVKELTARMGTGPRAMAYRVNAGAIPAGSWIQDPRIGGGRIIGEVCHFIDLMTHLCGALPLRVTADAMPDPARHQDTVQIAIAFANGAIGTIAYYANGPRSLPKERLEVFADGAAAVLDDFKRLTVYGKGRPWTRRLINQDKGQSAMVRAFCDSLRAGVAPIPPDALFAVTRATFTAMQALTQPHATAIA